jgi:hypothetical protein
LESLFHGEGLASDFVFVLYCVTVVECHFKWYTLSILREVGRHGYGKQCPQLMLLSFFFFFCLSFLEERQTIFASFVPLFVTCR